MLGATPRRMQYRRRDEGIVRIGLTCNRPWFCQGQFDQKARFKGLFKNTAQALTLFCVVESVDGATNIAGVRRRCACEPRNPAAQVRMHPAASTRSRAARPDSVHNFTIFVADVWTSGSNSIGQIIPKGAIPTMGHFFGHSARSRT